MGKGQKAARKAATAARVAHKQSMASRASKASYGKSIAASLPHLGVTGQQLGSVGAMAGIGRFPMPRYGASTASKPTGLPRPRTASATRSMGNKATRSGLGARLEGAAAARATARRSSVGLDFGGYGGPMRMNAPLPGPGLGNPKLSASARARYKSRFPSGGGAGHPAMPKKIGVTPEMASGDLKALRGLGENRLWGAIRKHPGRSAAIVGAAVGVNAIMSNTGRATDRTPGRSTGIYGY